MAIDTERRGRRAFLTALTGAGLAALAGVLRPSGARAADPNDVVLGAVNSSPATTTITNDASEATTAVRIVNTGTGIALEASSESNAAVFAASANSVGLLATSELREGVVGETAVGSRAGVKGISPRGTGVLGASADQAPNARPEVGVFGYSVYGEDSFGVYGESSQGTGVHGYAINGTGTSGQGSTGVHGKGQTGVRGESVIGAGVQGMSTASVGVYGVSEDLIGVAGEGAVAGVSGRSEEVGVFGTSSAPQGHAALIGNGKFNGPGVAGFSGTGQDETKQLPLIPDQTGVYGHAAQSSAAAGVVGQSTNGRGVVGKATSGTGVAATATSGVALSATSDSGYALSTSGRVTFQKAAGIAEIMAGARDVLVVPGIDLTGSSAVIATLNGFPGGSTTIQRVAVNTSANQFRIYLTANATAKVRVAWLVLG